MGKEGEKSGGYTATRTVLVIVGVPVLQMPSPSGSASEPLGEMPAMSLRGVSTLPTTVSIVCKTTRTRLAAVKRRVNARDFSALLELLDEEPWYAHHPWVRDMLRRRRDHPRLKRRRMRPRGRTKLDPLAVIGIVSAVVAARRARSREQAFGKIEEWGLCSAVTAKRLYAKALKNATTNPRAVAIEFAGDVVFATEAEVEAIRARADELRPHSTIERTVLDPERGGLTGC